MSNMSKIIEGDNKKVTSKTRDQRQNAIGEEWKSRFYNRKL